MPNFNAKNIFKLLSKLGEKITIFRSGSENPKTLAAQGGLSPQQQEKHTPVLTHNDELKATKEDLALLQGFPELCPPELASRFAPVYEKAEPEKVDPSTQNTRSRPRSRKVPADNAFEQTLSSLYGKRRPISDAELRQALLDAYGFTGLGELLSALKQDYEATLATELISRLESVLERYQSRISCRELLEDLQQLADAVGPPPPERVDAYSPPAPWVAQTKFEICLTQISRQIQFSDWREVGPAMYHLYAAADEQEFATRVLNEYGLSWAKVEYLRARLCDLSHELTPKLDPTRLLKAWLYFFFMRLWVLIGRPDYKPYNKPRDIPPHRDFDGDYGFGGCDGIYISREDWDPEFVRQEREQENALEQKKKKKRWSLPSLRLPKLRLFKRAAGRAGTASSDSSPEWAGRQEDESLIDPEEQEPDSVREELLLARYQLQQEEECSSGMIAWSKRMKIKRIDKILATLDAGKRPASLEWKRPERTQDRRRREQLEKENKARSRQRGRQRGPRGK